MLDRVATRVARVLLGWSASHGNTPRRRWIHTTRRDLDEIDGGRARLMGDVAGPRLDWIYGAGSGHRGPVAWPESWNIGAGGLLLGVLAWVVFTTHVPDIERTPAEMVFCFLGLYFYAAGFLAGRRTGQVGKGCWAGAIAGLAFGAVVCVATFTASAHAGFSDRVRGGTADQVSITLAGIIFFVLMGVVCGMLGARGALRGHRYGH